MVSKARVGSLRSVQVFDQALAGGGAKSINFQELAADLAQITFDYPFRIPPCESHLPPVPAQAA